MSINNVDIEKLDRFCAKRIINDVGSSGQPPIYGYQFFSAGLSQYTKTIDEEYLQDFIKCGGSSFKLVLGAYGGGKTHFLYTIQGMAWAASYISSYIELSPSSTPFHKLEQVYKSIITNLVYPQSPENLLDGQDRGIDAVLRSWYYAKMDELSTQFSEDELEYEIKDYVSGLGPYESTSFQNAIKNAFLALHTEDYDSFDLIAQWLKGENPPKTSIKEFKIFEKIDKSTAFKMIRCLNQWIQEIGYSGLIVLMDEAEQTPSMTTKERSALLQNLRELIDACSRGTLKGTMIFYAVPDESFLEGKTAIYEALNQRLSTNFEGKRNPSGVKIDLEDVSNEPTELLCEIGTNLAKIYEIAYGFEFTDHILKSKIQQLAQKAYNERYGEIGYKRNFVQEVIRSFHEIRSSV
jgi:hypothetical protein